MCIRDRSLTDKSTFFALAQGLFVWLTTTFMTWVNDTATAMNFNSTNDVSSTSVVIGTGSKSLTVSASKSYQGGMYVVISDNTTPGTSNSVNSMTAQVTSYNSSTGVLVVNVLKYLGSGTKTAWVISQCAMPSLDVSTTMQAVTTQTTLAAARTALDVPSNTEMNAAIVLATPPGAVVHFARSTAPGGWLKANGALVSRTTYAALFSAIGTTFGVGDGSTTFALPELRGEFLRGLDDGRGIDASRALGSAQADDFKSHSHTWNQSLVVAGASGSAVSVVGGGSLSNIGNTGGTETRPRNIALLVCIKY
jgi:hypothetical protein